MDISDRKGLKKLLDSDGGGSERNPGATIRGVIKSHHIDHFPKSLLTTSVNNGGLPTV